MRLYRRKCRHCREWFLPDPRNAYHQHYCGKDECRKASRAASQRKWRAKNPDYYRGQEHGERVREWRACHPYYWRRRGLSPARAKDLLDLQHTASQLDTHYPVSHSPTRFPPLQDLIMSDHFVLVGLAAIQAGPAFKDLIAPRLGRCYEYGKDLCSRTPGLLSAESDHGHSGMQLRDLTCPDPCPA